MLAMFELLIALYSRPCVVALVWWRLSGRDVYFSLNREVMTLGSSRFCLFDVFQPIAVNSIPSYNSPKLLESHNSDS